MTVPNKIYNLTRISTRRMGQEWTGGIRTNYRPQFAVTGLSLEAGLDQMVRGEITYVASYTGRNIDPDLDHMHLNWAILPSYYNTYGMKEVAAGANSQGIMYIKSFIHGVSPFLNKYQSHLVASGLQMDMTNYDPGECDLNGEYVYYFANMSSLKIFFLNPIVNNLSRLWASTAGGVEVILTGLGFDNNESELDEGGPDRGGWDDKVDELEFIKVQGQGTATFRDEFDDGSRDPVWTDAPNNGTITEAADLLTIAFGSGVSAGWQDGDAPYAVMTPVADENVIEVKINSYTVNDDCSAGIHIHDVIQATGGIGFTRYRNDSYGGRNGIMVWRVGTGQLAYTAVTILPVWLRIVTSGPKASATLKFYYSTDGLVWTLLHIVTSEEWGIVALYADNWGVDNALSVPFEYFVNSYEYGMTPEATLKESLGDFTVDSNSQITIPANKFPAMSAGTYYIRLKKLNVALEAATTIAGFAGDWKCDSNGRTGSSDRISFYISNTFTNGYGAGGGGGFRRRKKGPLILTDWHLKDRSDGTEIMKYYSMATVRCPDRVYKGSLSAISSIPRGFDDKTGLFKVTDITLDLANNDLEFSKLLAGIAILKNQIVKVYQVYPPGPFAWRSLICSTIIDDYSFEGDIFKVKLKDITQKYFRRSIPLDVCTADYEGFDYSNIHPDSIGAPVPEILGLCSLTTGEFRGQVEALCIDTVNFIYVAANRALKSIDQVYSDDPIAVNPANYTVSVEADGRTYITFTGDQEDKKVTFNCKGYMFSGLDSANGYVQNPAYIILYLFLILLEIPPDFIDFNSFDEVADVFTNMDEAEAGKLILQFQHDPMDVLQDLLAGSKCYPAKDGRLALGKKDEANYETNNSDPAPVLFRQIDAIEKSIRKYNLRDAINLINAAYDFIPTWDVFKSNLSQEADVSIDPWNPRPVEDNRESRTVRRRRGRRPVRPWVR